MAIAVIGGLITSTALTLVIVPAVFTLIDDIERWLGPKFGRVLIAPPPQVRSALTASSGRVGHVESGFVRHRSGACSQQRPRARCAPAWWVRMRLAACPWCCWTASRICSAGWPSACFPIASTWSARISTQGLSRARRSGPARRHARLLRRLRADAGGDREGRHPAGRGDPRRVRIVNLEKVQAYLAQRAVGAARGGAPVQLGVDAARPVARARLSAGCGLQAAGRQLGRARDEEAAHPLRLPADPGEGAAGGHHQARQGRARRSPWSPTRSRPPASTSTGRGS